MCVLIGAGRLGAPDRTEPDDEELLARIRARDVEALDALYRRYSGQACALAYRMLGNKESAEEVMQDAFLSVWRQAATYDEGVGRARPWLLSIVHHRAIDRLRRARERQTAAPLDDAWMHPADADVFRDVYRTLQGDQIRAALARLRDEQRQAIELAYFGGRSFAEIADMTLAPVGTVKSRVRLGIARLRQILDREIVS